MKWKRYMCLLLSALMVIALFTGCRKPTIDTDDLKIPTEYPQIKLEESLEFTEKPNIVNGVYATCENYSFTVYHGISQTTYSNPTVSFKFYLISEQALPEDAQIYLNDVTASYIAKITDKTPASFKEWNGYASQIGSNQIFLRFLKEPYIDFGKYYSDYIKLHEKISQLQRYGETEGLSEALLEMELLQANLHPDTQEFYQNFRNTTPVPYHYYEVEIRIISVKELEQVKSVSLVSSSETTRVFPIRNLWLDTADRDSIGAQERLNLRTAGIGLTTAKFPESDFAASDPWKAGTSVSKSFSFVTLKDIMLEEAYIYGANTRVILENAQIAIKDNAEEYEYKVWDMATPLSIDEGEYISVQFVWTDEYTDQANYAIDATVIVKYSTKNNQTGFFKCFINESRQVAPLRLYYWVYKDFDLKSYLQDFERPYDEYFLNHY